MRVRRGVELSGIRGFVSERLNVDAGDVAHVARSASGFAGPFTGGGCGEVLAG